MNTYPEPLEKLLTYGDPNAIEMEGWPDYLASGITTEHIPALLRMIIDPALRTTDNDDEDPKYWTAIYVWRALGQLQDASAVEPLLQQTEGLMDYDSGFGDWATEELPEVYEAIGPSAIPILTKYIADPTQHVHTRVNAMTGLAKIYTKYPEHRDKGVAFFTEQLEQFAQNDPEINSNLIMSLSHSKAIETLPLIQTVFEDGNIDTFLIGLEDVEVSFGLRERPEPRFTDFQSFLQSFAPSEDEGQQNTIPENQAFPQLRAQIAPPKPHNLPKGSKNKQTKKAQVKAARKQKRKK